MSFENNGERSIGAQLTSDTFTGIGWSSEKARAPERLLKDTQQQINHGLAKVGDLYHGVAQGTEIGAHALAAGSAVFRTSFDQDSFIQATKHLGETLDKCQEQEEQEDKLLSRNPKRWIIDKYCHYGLDLAGLGRGQMNRCNELGDQLFRHIGKSFKNEYTPLLGLGRSAATTAKHLENLDLPGIAGDGEAFIGVSRNISINAVRYVDRLVSSPPDKRWEMIGHDLLPIAVAEMAVQRLFGLVQDWSDVTDVSEAGKAASLVQGARSVVAKAIKTNEEIEQRCGKKLFGPENYEDMHKGFEVCKPLTAPVAATVLDSLKTAKRELTKSDSPQR